MSQKSSRVGNTVKNIKINFIMQAVNMLAVFVSRAIFIKCLSIEYLGVNGLFSNVLQLLSFAELGIGSAIVYNLYKPLDEGNIPRIQALMQFYKTAYFFIGVTIAVLGLSIVPFLGNLIKSKPNIPENITFIYLLFLTDTVMSYYFIYKRSLIIADQKIYIVSIYTQIFNTLRIIVQLIILWLTANFVLYLIMQILGTFLCNYAIAKKADKMYPYLTHPVCEKLSSVEIKSIFSDVRAIALYKLCSAVLYGMPNIIISKFIGLMSVGLVSNYVVITGAINTISGQLNQAMMSSIGNLNAGPDVDRQKEVFEELMFSYVWLYGYLSVCVCCLSNEFISAWVGKQYMLNGMTVFAMVAFFYIDKIRLVPYMYRMTLGYFVQGRYIALLAVIMNIPLSILGASKIGVAGVFFAMAISILCTFMVIDPLLIYTRRFETSVWKFYKKCAEYTAVVFLAGGAVYCVNNVVRLSGFIGFLVHGIIATVVFNCIFIAVYYKSRQFQAIKNILLKQIKKNSNS